MKFKLGDQVEFISNCQSIKKGDTGVVIDIRNGHSLPYLVAFNGKDCSVTEDEIELVVSAISTYTIQEIAAELLRRYGDSL